MSDTEKLVFLNPDEIAIGDNVRFSLKPYRIERLSEEILRDGGVNTPIEVQPVSGREDGKKYLLTAGHIRTEAVRKLNTEQKAGLTLPARVVALENEGQRILRQVSENTERENMSPMDQAIAINKLIASGLSKMDVRKAFAQPGGRKGIKVQPASNSWLNIRLSFLDFPKDIQRKIHDGIIPVGAAYELAKHPRDKWTDIVDRAEKERIRAIETEEKEEERYLKSQKDIEEKTAAQEATEKEYAEVKDTSEKAAAAAKEKMEAVKAAFEETLKKGLDKDTKKSVEDTFKSAKAEAKTAEEVAEKTKKELAKLEERRKAVSEKAAAARARLEAARAAKEVKNPKKAEAGAGKVTGDSIKKAAKEEVAEAKPVKLNAAEMREAVRSISILAGTKRPKTAAVGVAILECFDGKITDGQLEMAVSRLVGEEPMPKK